MGFIGAIWRDLAQFTADESYMSVPNHAKSLHAHSGAALIDEFGVRLATRDRSKTAILAANTPTKRRHDGSDAESSVPSSRKVRFVPF